MRLVGKSLTESVFVALREEFNDEVLNYMWDNDIIIGAEYDHPEEYEPEHWKSLYKDALKKAKEEKNRRMINLIKPLLKEATDEELEKLKVELKSRADDLSWDGEISGLSDEDINALANIIKQKGFFISNNIFTDSSDEYEWEQINMFLDNEIRDYVGSLKDTEEESYLQDRILDYERKGRGSKEEYEEDKERLKSMQESASEYDSVGSIEEIDGKKYYVSDSTFNGHCYKNANTYNSDPDGVCYITEAGFENDDKISVEEIEANKAKLVEEGTISTKNSIMDEVRTMFTIEEYYYEYDDGRRVEAKDFDEKLIEEIADDAFNVVDWQTVNGFLLERDWTEAVEEFYEKGSIKGDLKESSEEHKKSPIRRYTAYVFNWVNDHGYSKEFKKVWEKYAAPEYDGMSTEEIMQLVFDELADENGFNGELFVSPAEFYSNEAVLNENAVNELVPWMYDNFPDNSFYKEGKLDNGKTVYYFDKHGDMEAVKKAIKDKFGDEVSFGTAVSEYAPEQKEFVVIMDSDKVNLTKFDWEDGLEGFTYYVDDENDIYAKNNESGRLYFCTGDGDPETEIQDDMNYIINESGRISKNRKGYLKERYFPGSEEQYFCNKCGLAFDEDQLTGTDDEGNAVCPACGSTDIIDTGKPGEEDSEEQVGLWVNGKVYWEGNKSDVDENLLLDVADQASEEDGRTYDYDEVDIKPMNEGKEELGPDLIFSDIEGMVEGTGAEVVVEDLNFKGKTDELVDLINAQNFTTVSEVIEFIETSSEVEKLRREDLNESKKPAKKKEKKDGKRVIMQQGNVTCFKENDNKFLVFENESDNEKAYKDQDSAMADFMTRVGVDPNSTNDKK